MWWRRSDGTLVAGPPPHPSRHALPDERAATRPRSTSSRSSSLAKTDAFIRAWNQENPVLRIDVFHLARLGPALGVRAHPEHPPLRRRRSPLRPQGDLVLVRGQAEARDRLAARRRQASLRHRRVASRRWSRAWPRHAGRPQVRATSTAVERELGLLMFFPGFVRRIIMQAHQRPRPPRDAAAELHRARPDVRARRFFANMASLGMPPVYHHLYEYGTCGVLRLARAPRHRSRAAPRAAPTGAAR